jgi:hypothetical protein
MIMASVETVENISALLPGGASAMRGQNRSPRRLSNAYCLIVLCWHFNITLNFSDRRDSNSDHAAPAQLYRGNLPHYHWPSRRVPPVRTFFAHPIQMIGIVRSKSKDDGEERTPSRRDAKTALQAAVRFLPFFTLPRLSCSAVTKSMTLLLGALGAGARRFWPFAFASISFWTSSV